MVTANAYQVGEMNFRIFKIIALLTAVFFIAICQSVFAAEPMSKAQLAKLNALIADQGNMADIGKITSDSFGITKTNDPPILMRGFGAKDENRVTHQISKVPNDKGYILVRFTPGKNLIYWADKNLKLVSATTFISTTAPTVRMPDKQARDGLAEELGFMAKVADNPDAY